MSHHDRGLRGVRRVALGVALAAAGLAAGGCAECAGTPSCTGQPEVSAGGQVINHKSGKPVAGVQVTLVRTGGVETVGDTARAVTDGEGFFTLRLGSVYTGQVTGRMRIAPPPPYAPYDAGHVTLESTRRRGEGRFLGRYVADPFFIMIGEVHRSGGGPITGATIVMRRLSGGRLAQDSVVMTSEGGGRFGWVDPPVLEIGPITAEFRVRAPDDPREFREVQTVDMQYMDGTIGWVMLFLPR